MLVFILVSRYIATRVNPNQLQWLVQNLIIFLDFYWHFC